MKAKISRYLNAAIAVIVPLSWGIMFYRWQTSGILSASGWQSLRYFTVLSNLFAGAVSLACFCFWKSIAGNRKLSWWKMLSTGAVALTFTVVVTFLGPTSPDGFLSLFQGANFFMHFLTPILAAVDYMFFYPDHVRFTVKETLASMLPTVLYGAGYLANLLINGPGTPEHTNDWYGFARWGMGATGIVFAVCLLVTWGQVLLFRFVHNRVAGACQ